MDDDVITPPSFACPLVIRPIRIGQLPELAVTLPSARSMSRLPRALLRSTSDRACPIQTAPVAPWYRTMPVTSPIRTAAELPSMVAVPAMLPIVTSPPARFARSAAM
jgi:hypothetical protein